MDNSGAAYDVHYKGWNSSWDEWVEEGRVRKFTWETHLTAQEAKAELKREQQELAAKEAAEAAVRAAAEVARLCEAAALPLGGGEKKKKKKKKKREREEKESDVLDVVPFPKRAKAGAVYPDPADVELPLPELLVQFVMSDCEFVTRERRLVPLPRAPSVSSILKAFLRLVEAVEDDPRIAIVDGVRLLFNAALPVHLLYRFERLQHVELRQRLDAAADTRDLADVYGAEHLLRLLVRIPSVIAHSQYTQDELPLLLATLADLVAFLEANPHFFLDEYDAPTAQYIRTSAINNS